MSISQNLVATTGTYQQHGEEKKRYQTCGMVSIKSKDSANLTEEQIAQMVASLDISIKFELLPVSNEWNGWFSVYPKKDRQQSQGIAPQQGHNAQTQPQGYGQSNQYQQPVQQPSQGNYGQSVQGQHPQVVHENIQDSEALPF